MRVLGIDPGTRKTGWGVVEKRGTRLVAIASGTIKASAKKPLQERLFIIHNGLSKVLQEYEPAVVALEDIFFAKYANAAMKLGHARGVAMLACSQADRIVHAYPPALVKRTVAGKGNAPKEQVGRLVGALLGLRVLPDEDACDALAIAITHLQASAVPSRMKRR